MKKLEFTPAVFVASAVDSKDFPKLRSERGDPLPEIALAGRSNVGKSSLINHLTRTAGVARVSSTPGKTQTINFYAVEEKLMLVDFPGYGYAKVPHKMREEWGRFISHYFLERRELKAVVLLLDIRRIPSEDDIAMAEWTIKQKKPLIFVFTKTDKIKEREVQELAEHALQSFSHLEDVASFPPIFYSIQEKTGRDRLIRTLNEIL